MYENENIGKKNNTDSDKKRSAEKIASVGLAGTRNFHIMPK